MTAESALLGFFAATSLAGGVLMLVARHPMRVALALISTMVSLAAIYAILGVHVIAVFQVLIYVGAVMVFMVYVIMLLDVRDPSFLARYGRALTPSVVLAALLAAALAAAVGSGRMASPAAQAAVAGDVVTAQAVPGRVAFEVQPFSVEFLERYWLHFELTSVLLLAAVVAAIAVIRTGRRHDGHD